MKHLRAVPIVLLCSVACGGSYPEPRDQLAEAEAALRAADVAGADDTPRSKLHLKRAKEQIDEARALIADEEFELADLTLRRALADAELALVLAREESQKKEAAESKEKLAELQKLVEQAK